MTYEQANELIPKFIRLIGIPTNDSVVIKIIVSYIEPTVAENHFFNMSIGVSDNREAAYANDYTLWAKLDDGKFLPVKSIITNNKVEDLYESRELLD